jgi:hypothetical protein
MRRALLLLAVVAVAVVLATSGLAWAADITGTEGNDIIVGTVAPDKIEGLGGDDTISGLDDNDSVYGGPGNDSLYGGNEVDIAIAQDGDDALRGGDGNDKIFGGSGADLLRGGVGDDTIDDGPADDAALDDIVGGAGNDDIVTLNSPASKDTVSCGDGTDRVQIDALDFFEEDCEKVHLLTGAETLPNDPEFYRLAEESFKGTEPIVKETAAETTGEMGTLATCTRSQWTGRPYKYKGTIWAKTELHNGGGCSRVYVYGSLRNTSGFYKPTLDTWGTWLRRNNGLYVWQSGRCQNGYEEYRNLTESFWWEARYRWITC